VAFVGSDKSVYLASVSGAVALKLINGTDPITGLRWSPAGDKFAFVKAGDIYVMSIDGSNQTKISTHTSSFGDANPRWSPDGQKILFTRDDADAYVMDASGQNVSRLLNSVSSRNATWSPDGQRVAFQYGNALAVMNLDETGFAQLTAGAEPDWQPLPTSSPTPSPTPTTLFTISGHITPANTGVLFQLTGTRTGTRAPDQNGNYSFVNLPSGGNYTITPESDLQFFNPSSRTYTNLNANQTDADFTVGGNITLSISGRLSEPNGNSIVNADVTLTQSNVIQRHTTTDANGHYEFTNLIVNGTWSVTPTINSTYTYLPAVRGFFLMRRSQLVDFVGYKSDPISISGRITDAANPGAGINPAQVQLVGTATTALTDANGNFTIPNLAPGHDYTVRVNTPSGTYFPSQISFKSLVKDQNAYFVRYEPRQLGSISGRATGANGDPASDLLLTLAGAGDLSAVTDQNGRYSFVPLPEGFDYIITPHRFGVGFAPSHRTVSNLTGNVTIPDLVLLGIADADQRAFQFNSPAYTVAEEAGSALITVTRWGVSSPATVDYTTSNGSAQSSSDYTATSGTLSFAEGETTKTFTVPITNDAFKENPETVNLILSNPTVGWLDDQSVAVLTITDTDTTPGPTPTPTPTPSPGIEFSAATFAVNEGAGSLTVTVMRNGSSAGTATVDYLTLDDPAEVRCDTINGISYARCDYATTIDRLTFAPGETTKTFSIPIIDDAFAEGPETFGISLLNPTGATLGAISTATVTINDNETAVGANPIFTTPFFVRQHYLDFLSREPEVGEPWSAVLNNCSDVNNNPNCDRLTVSGAFFGSQEFQLKGYYAFRFYKLAFNRLPLYSEIVTDMRAVTGQTPAEVFQKKAAYANAFVQRTEFANSYGGVPDFMLPSILMGHYNLSSITTPDPAAPDGSSKVTLTVSDLTNQLSTGALTRGQVLRAIADSDQVLAAEFNKAFVAMQYYGYLRRTPEPSGYSAWLNYLNAHPTDSRTMVNGFMNSQEYRLRFGPTQ